VLSKEAPFQPTAFSRSTDAATSDTVYVPPGSKVKIAFDANNPGIWAFHCHILYHGARGMFTVVKYEDTPTPFWKPEEAPKILKGLRE